MTISNTHPSFEHDERARKRAEIGLSPHRPTAKAAPQRPPRPDNVRGCLWSFVVLLAALLASTSLLVLARMVDSPMDWPSVRENVMLWLSNIDIRVQEQDGANATPVSGSYRLVFDEEFKTENSVLRPNIQEGQWSFSVLPGEGVYHMQIAPNRLAWSTVGIAPLVDVSLEASITIADLNPAGYGGLLARFLDDDNFYLFAIDGQGRWQVQLLQDGRLLTIVPWQRLMWINPSGESNLMALEDDGQVLRLHLNGEAIYELVDSALPPGDAGVFAAAPANTMAQIDIDWLRLYEQTGE